MPRNPFIYYGLLVIVAAAAIYVGAWLTRQIEFVVPYAIAAGILLVIVGLIAESRKRKDSGPGSA